MQINNFGDGPVKLPVGQGRDVADYRSRFDKSTAHTMPPPMKANYLLFLLDKYNFMKTAGFRPN
jgi:hypothetical protein